MQYNPLMAHQHQIDAELLRAAIIGYEKQIAVLREQVVQIQKKLGARPVSVSGLETKSRRPPLSAAARQRISLAQKKRWAEYNQQIKKAASP